MQQITLHPRTYVGQIDFKELAHIIMIEGAGKSSFLGWAGGLEFK